MLLHNSYPRTLHHAKSEAKKSKAEQSTALAYNVTEKIVPDWWGEGVLKKKKKPRIY